MFLALTSGPKQLEKRVGIKCLMYAEEGTPGHQEEKGPGGRAWS